MTDQLEDIRPNLIFEERGRNPWLVNWLSSDAQTVSITSTIIPVGERRTCRCWLVTECQAHLFVFHYQPHYTRVELQAVEGKDICLRS